MLRARSLVLLLAVETLAACAGTAPRDGAPAASATHRRRRRHRAASVGTDVPTARDDTAGAAGGGSSARAPAVSQGFGSPVVRRGAAGSELSPRWVSDAEQPRIVCEGDATAQVPSSQSPWEPTHGMVVRAFQSAEHGVLGCEPPSNAEGRFVIRARFNGSGVPEEFGFPDGRVSAGQARCIGQALCAMRTPAFRARSATVSYPVVVMVPGE